jgi:nucleotide-binding universal stress UspA family protein
VFSATRSLNTADLIMRAGRPVLLVPRSAQSARLDHALIGWKDSRETRRAVSDALPLLRHARKVSAVEFAAETDLAEARRRLEDLATWLGRHGVPVQCQARLSSGDDATALYAHGQDLQSDVIVAGAYGHSRLREWVMGGVTRDLLLSNDRCALLSH